MGTTSLPAPVDEQLVSDLGARFSEQLASHRIDFVMAMKHHFERAHVCRMFVDKTVDLIRRGYLSFSSPVDLTSRQLATLDDNVYSDVLAACSDMQEANAQELVRGILKAYASFGCTVTRGVRRS